MTLDDSTYLLENFPELFLGFKSIPQKHREVLRNIGERGSRTALVAANGTGKTSCIELASILWHMVRFPGSLTVVTAGAYRQLSEALWPHIREKTMGMGGEAVGWNVTEDKVVLKHKDGSESRCISYAVSDPNKAEGYHTQGRDQNLLYIIDEGKGVPDGVYDAMERCQPTRVLVMSSPGAPEGRFFQIAKGWGNFKVFRIVAKDCPWITDDWIKQQVEMHGENSPLVRSMIYAEFVETEGEALVLGPNKLRNCLDNPPNKNEEGPLVAGCDFAAGGDSNVIVVRKGNNVREKITWKERNTMSAVGRFITEFKRLGLNQDDIWADAGGLGLPMCDALREAGWDINRVNNGSPAFNSDHYLNRGTEMWVRFARMAETNKVLLPNEESLFNQLTTRRLLYDSKGRLKLESKEDMRKRGLPSPDEADALILAFCGPGASIDGYFGQNRSMTPLIESLNNALDEEAAFIGGCHVAS